VHQSRLAIPVGVNLTSIGVPADWWLSTAALLESAGFSGVWCWDHFVSRGKLTDPVLECWTMLTATAATTSRLRVGSFVSNVMNRHPAVLARMAATVHAISGGRIDVGIGIGGHPAEHQAYGIDFPEPPERAARLEEAVQVLRLLWTGGPVDFDGRFYQLNGAHAFPAPRPAPRIIVGGEKPAGARLAARIGDGWAMNGPDFDRLLPEFLGSLEAAGRSRTDVRVVVTLDLDGGTPPERQPALVDLAATATEWRERGADELVLHWIRPRDLPAILGAAERAGLAG
jgi:alkanesulfonate monooxygenase SsuD/methylene tetrahydromethanopterin reductase-like flavin-dependent oxidoreductase (luciferase family)